MVIPGSILSTKASSRSAAEAPTQVHDRDTIDNISVTKCTTQYVRLGEHHQPITSQWSSSTSPISIDDNVARKCFGAHLGWRPGKLVISVPLFLQSKPFHAGHDVGRCFPPAVRISIMVHYPSRQRSGGHRLCPSRLPTRGSRCHSHIHVCMSSITRRGKANITVP